MSLQRYVLKRVLVTVPILIGATLLTFGLVALTPGDPVDYITAFQDVSPEVEQSLREQYGLDKPLYMQYFDWLSGAVQFEFGDSISNQRPVSTMIMNRLPYTLLMGSMAFMVTLITAIPTGIVAAYYRGSIIDNISRVFSVVGIAIPNFFLGLILLLVTRETLTETQFGRLMEATDGTILCRWESGGSERARTMIVQQFRGVLSRIEDENIVRFETEIGDAGFDISDVRKIR